MSESQWTGVDRYFAETLLEKDPLLDSIVADNEVSGLPLHQVSATQGRLLELLCRIAGAKRVLEIGTLAGYSTIWFARAVGPEGVVCTIEAEPRHATVARRSFAASGLADRIDLREGTALDVLDGLIEADEQPFDLIFIDADKPNNPGYLQRARRLSRVGTVIIGDNVVRGGAVIDPEHEDARVQGVRTFLGMLGDAPGMPSTAIQTVGDKGWDGFSLSIVTELESADV